MELIELGLVLEERDEGILISKLRERDGTRWKEGKEGQPAKGRERYPKVKRRAYPAGDGEDLNEVRILILDSCLDSHRSWALERHLTNEEPSEPLQLGELPAPIRVLSEVVSDVRRDGESTEKRSLPMKFSKVAHSKVVCQQSELSKVGKRFGENGEYCARESEGRVGDFEDSKLFHGGDEPSKSGNLRGGRRVLVRKELEREGKRGREFELT